MSFRDSFLDPPKDFTIIPFWFLNDDLDEAEIVRQIDDFYDHGVYGFVPHARIGLPESIPYMGDRWLHFTQFAIDHAAKKGMTVILYDEGMYPSGSCHGQVVAANPYFATRALERRPKSKPPADGEELIFEDDEYLYVNTLSNGHIRGVHYGTDDGEPGAPPSADILNPEAVQAFFYFALEPYYERMPDHFGKTIKAVFTDEPSMLGRGHKKGVRAWTWGIESHLEDYFGRNIRPDLPILFDKDHPNHETFSEEYDKALIARLKTVYYEQYEGWCHAHGVDLTGHPAQPDDIGHLRHFHLPGQDIVWRYIEPYKSNAIEGPQSTQAKCASSAQAHYGRSRNLNECFGAYGWNFTEEEMWWVTNWLLVRGCNLISPHAFYYSVRDKRRDERPPDVGPNNVWWDHYKNYADYCRRLCWLNATGEHVCEVAILGAEASLPWRAAKVCYENQIDFNYLDDATLRERCTVDADGIRIEGMHYKAVIVDGEEYLTDDVAAKLKPMEDAGRLVNFEPSREDAMVTSVDELVPHDLWGRSEYSRPLRVRRVKIGKELFYLFTNEGKDPVGWDLKLVTGQPMEWWDPETGTSIHDAKSVMIPPYRARILRCLIT